MKKPSKGPWIRDGYIVRQPGGRIIADVGPHHTPPDQYPLACKLEDEANGDAIAALPELVEALKAMLVMPNASFENKFVDAYFISYARKLAKEALAKIPQS